MPTKLTDNWLNLAGGMLMTLVLLGTTPVTAASGPRLLWSTEPQHG